MEFNGTIVRLLTETSGTSARTGKPWSKQEFIIENNADRVRQSLKFSVFNTQIDEMKAQGLAVGAVGTLTFDAYVQEYNGRYYNDLRGWRWTPAPSWEQAAAKGVPVAQPTAQTQRPKEMPINMAATQQGQRIPAAVAQPLPLENDLPF